MRRRISKPYEEALAADIEHLRLVVHHGADFLLKIVEHPHVVVAEEEVYLNAAVGQFGQFAQQAGIAARHKMAVSEPEVEHITKQEQLAAVGFNVVEQVA